MLARLPLLNLLFYVALVIINFLAIQLPFFGKSPGDVSDLFPNLLTPADFAFKIWSVIYILLGVFIFAQTQAWRRSRGIPPEVAAIGPLFLLTCLFNVAWLVTWQSLHIAWSFVSIFILWLLLMRLYYRLATLGSARWVYTLPFSVYFGWVCIAALANLNVLFMDLSVSFLGFPEEQWTTALIGLGIGGTLLVLYLNQDIWFTAVLIWAFYGIYSKNQAIGSADSWVVSMSLLAMVILTLAGLAVAWWKWRGRVG